MSSPAFWSLIWNIPHSFAANSIFILVPFYADQYQMSNEWTYVMFALELVILSQIKRDAQGYMNPIDIVRDALKGSVGLATALSSFVFQVAGFHIGFRIAHACIPDLVTDVKVSQTSLKEEYHEMVHILFMAEVGSTMCLLTMLDTAESRLMDTAKWPRVLHYRRLLYNIVCAIIIAALVRATSSHGIGAMNPAVVINNHIFFDGLFGLQFGKEMVVMVGGPAFAAALLAHWCEPMSAKQKTQ